MADEIETVTQIQEAAAEKASGHAVEDGSVRRQRDPGARRARGGAQAPGHVHRLHRRARPAPPDLGDRRQRGRRGAGRPLRPDRGHADRRRRDPGRGQRSRHPHRHRARPGAARGDPGADHAARRRQVRRRRLQGVRRPARRRRLRGQRAVQPPDRRGPQPRPRVAADRSPSACPTARSSRCARWSPARAPAPRSPTGPPRTIFETTHVLPRDDHQPVPRVRLPQQGPRDRGPRRAACTPRSPHRTSRTTRCSTRAPTSPTAAESDVDPRRGRRHGAAVPLRPRPGRLRRAPQPAQGQGQPDGDQLRGLDAREPRAADEPRGRDAVEHLLPGVGPHVRQHHQHPRGRHPRGGLPRGADRRWSTTGARSGG